jgi:hypothetical protein
LRLPFLILIFFGGTRTLKSSPAFRGGDVAAALRRFLRPVCVPAPAEFKGLLRIRKVEYCFVVVGAGAVWRSQFAVEAVWSLVLYRPGSALSVLLIA